MPERYVVHERRGYMQCTVRTTLSGALLYRRLLPLQITTTVRL